MAHMGTWRNTHGFPLPALEQVTQAMWAWQNAANGESKEKAIVIGHQGRKPFSDLFVLDIL